MDGLQSRIMPLALLQLSGGVQAVPNTYAVFFPAQTPHLHELKEQGPDHSYKATLHTSYRQHPRRHVTQRHITMGVRVIHTLDCMVSYIYIYDMPCVLVFTKAQEPSQPGRSQAREHEKKNTHKDGNEKIVLH